WRSSAPESCSSDSSPGSLLRQLQALSRETRRDLFEHVVEHGFRIELRAAAERAVGVRFTPGGGDLLLALLRERRLALLGPFAQRDQVRFESLDRVAERPALELVLGAVARRIVARGMRRDAIGDQLDQRRPG